MSQRRSVNVNGVYLFETLDITNFRQSQTSSVPKSAHLSTFIILIHEYNNYNYGVTVLFQQCVFIVRKYALLEITKMKRGAHLKCKEPVLFRRLRSLYELAIYVFNVKPMTVLLQGTRILCLFKKLMQHHF